MIEGLVPEDHQRAVLRLRVRSQGLRRHHAGARQRRAISHPCEGAARQTYDGHTLAAVIPEIDALIGNAIERILADKGYRGHNAPPDYKFRVFTSGQKRRMTRTIKRELRQRSAVEPVIGHLKSEHRMDRNYLWYRQGDSINAVLAAAGYNFRRLLGWLSRFLFQILTSFGLESPPISVQNPRSSRTASQRHWSEAIDRQ
jgi:hypothetical protein